MSRRRGVATTDVDARQDTIEAVEIAIGSDGDDTIGGDDAANPLAGMRGDDEITADDGADQLWVGRGNDTLRAGSGLNCLTGRAGADSCSTRSPAMR